MRKWNNGLEGLTRREFLYLTGVGTAGVTLAGIPESSRGAGEKPKYGGRVRIGERYGSPGLDAHKNNEVIDFLNYSLMYNALTTMGPAPQVIIYPDLAKSWEISSDGKEYVFSLREGVKFHHGKELDSGDVKYSIERVMNPATRSPKAFSFIWVDSIQAADKYHVRIRMKQPFAPFLTTLTVQSCPIIPAGWQPTGTKPAPGTGPFVLKSFLPNESTEFTRFDQYWEVDEKTGDRLPYLDGIFMKKIVDPTVRWIAIRAGDLEYIPDPPRKNVLDAMKNPVPGIYIVLVKPIGNQWIYFNVTKPPFNHKKIRQAIAHCVDKEEFMQAVHWGMAEPINNQPFLNGSRMYIPVEDRTFDLAKAKQLLAEAGYPNGFKTDFLEPAGVSYDIAGCEYVIGQMQKIKIGATMKVVDRAVWLKNMREGEYFISFRGDSERMDPDDAYYQRFHSSEVGKNNYSRFTTPEIDALLEKGRATLKWEDRVPIYRKVVEMIREEVPHLYIAKAKIPLVFRDYVKGFGEGLGTWLNYHGGGMRRVWLDK